MPATATELPEVPAERKPDLSRLDETDKLVLDRLHRAGKSQVEIAHVLGCHESTISRALKKLSDSRTDALQYLHSEAITLARRVIQKADVDQSLEVLDRLDVAPRKQRDAGTHAGVQILIGMPGSPAGPLPVLTLSPATFASDAPEQGAGSD